MALTELAKPEQSGVRQIELDVTGMFCGACAKRIEKKLNKLDGVHASVDFGTGIAVVEASSDISVADLCVAVQKAGYGAEQRSEASADDGPDARAVTGPRRFMAPVRMAFQMMRSRMRT